MGERIKVRVVVDIGDLRVKIKADSVQEIVDYAGFVSAIHDAVQAKVREYSNIVEQKT